MRTSIFLTSALVAAAAVACHANGACHPALRGGGVAEKVGGFVGGFLRTESFGDVPSPHLVAPEGQVPGLGLRGGGEDAKEIVPAPLHKNNPCTIRTDENCRCPAAFSLFAEIEDRELVRRADWHWRLCPIRWCSKARSAR